MLTKVSQRSWDPVIAHLKSGSVLYIEDHSTGFNTITARLYVFLSNPRMIQGTWVHKTTEIFIGGINARVTSTTNEFTTVYPCGEYGDARIIEHVDADSIVSRGGCYSYFQWFKFFETVELFANGDWLWEEKGSHHHQISLIKPADEQYTCWYSIGSQYSHLLASS